MGATRDIRNQLKPEIALDPVAVNTNTTTVGAIIDTADYNKGVVFTFFQKIWTAGTATPLIEESADSGFATSNEVEDQYLIGDVETGQEADSALTATRTVSSLGVAGNPKRYIRLSIVTTDGPDIILAATAHGDPDVVPIVN